MCECTGQETGGKVHAALVALSVWRVRVMRRHHSIYIPVSYSPWHHSELQVTQLCLTLWPHGLYSPWNSPGQNTGVLILSLLQGIVPTQESIQPRSPTLQADFLPAEPQGKLPWHHKYSLFEGIDSIYRVLEELWMEVLNILQDAVVKTIHKKRKCRKAKWLSEEALQIAEKRREVKGKGEKQRTPFECRVPKNSKDR